MIKNNQILLILIIILGLMLRLVSLDQSLWWDEAINVVYARSNDFWWYVTKYPLGDFHPPGWFAILWVWGYLFGYSEISVRLPSLIFGMATIYLIYLIGQIMFSRKVGMMAALLLATAPLHLYYCQEARMYSFAAFTVTLSIYYLISFLSGKRYAFWGYSLSVILLLFSDYVAYLILPVELLFVLLINKKKFVKYLLSLLIAILVYAPWLVILPRQILQGKQTADLITGWAETVGGANIHQALLLPVKVLIGKISFDNYFLYGTVIIIAAFPYLFVVGKILSPNSKYPKLLLAWLTIPPLMGFVFSFYIPVFSYFRFIFILPAFYLLVAYGIERMDKSWSKVLFGLIVLIEVFASLVYLINPQYQRENWREAVKMIEKDRYGHKAVVLFKYNEVPSPFTYYSTGLTIPLPLFRSIPVDQSSDLYDFDNIFRIQNQVYVFEYLAAITDPKRLLEKRLQQLGFFVSKVYDFNGVGFVCLYSK